MGSLTLIFYSAPVPFKFTVQSRFTAVLVGVKAKKNLQGELQNFRKLLGAGRRVFGAQLLDFCCQGGDARRPLSGSTPRRGPRGCKFGRVDLTRIFGLDPSTRCLAISTSLGTRRRATSNFRRAYGTTTALAGSNY